MTEPQRPAGAKQPFRLPRPILPADVRRSRDAIRAYLDVRDGMSGLDAEEITVAWAPEDELGRPLRISDLKLALACMGAFLAHEERTGPKPHTPEQPPQEGT